MPQPANPVLRILHRYIFWTYERGSFHYDVMVTVILLFLFLSPRVIDFKDKPVQTVALHASEVLVREAGTSLAGTSRFIYEIRAEDIDKAAAALGHSTTTEAGLRAAILQTVEPIAGEVSIERSEPVLDTHGKTVAYKVWIIR